MKARIFLLISLLAILVLPKGVLAVSVAPAFLELQGARGAQVSSSFTLINPSLANQTYFFRTVKFEASGESGQPRFLPDDREGLPSWIQFPSHALTVPANSKADAPFTVAIPPGVPSGGYYAAILVSNAPAEVVAANGASIEASVAVLVFLTVEGETVEKAALLDITSPEEGKWLDLPQGAFSFRLQNQGNVHLQPKGRLEIRDLFGRVVFVNAVNADGSRALPGTTRTFSGSFGPSEPLNWWGKVRAQVQAFALGPMRARLVLDEGLPETITAEFGFWMFPWQCLLLFVAVVVVVVAVPRRFRRK
jgi:hypothetical protein